MTVSSKQLWLLAGGNGAGTSTFYRLFLAPRGIKLVNADLIAKEINPEHPEQVSYQGDHWVERIWEDLLDQDFSFCFESVFSHPTKIDFVAKAKARGYEIVLVYIHLDSLELNEARVHQRVTEGGYAVPVEKIRKRIPRTMKHIATILPLVNEARLLNNSSRQNPYRQVAHIRQGRRVAVIDSLPSWAEEMLRDIP